MQTGLDLLEHVFHQLHAAGLVGSKAEFSSRLLGRSSGYLTSMRARQRKASTETVMALDSALRSEVTKRSLDIEVADRIVMRQALADIRAYLEKEQAELPLGDIPCRQATPSVDVLP